MTDNRNTILAVILSGLVLIAWQYFYNVPQMERQRAQSQAQTELAKSSTPATRRRARPRRNPARRRPSPATPGQPAAAAPVVSRDAAIAATPRVKIDTPRVTGSISLKGARIDDLSLVQYPRDGRSRPRPPIVLFSPSNTAQSLLCRIRLGAGQRLDRRAFPTRTRCGSRKVAARCRRATPVTLKYDNGEGLTFRRTIAIDDRYLFTIKDDVTNVGNAPVDAVSVRADLAPRHAGGLRLLHPA